MLSPELLKILVCPKCKGELAHLTDKKAESLVCNRCKLRFEVIDDIPIMRLDRAHPLNQAYSGDPV